MAGLAIDDPIKWLQVFQSDRVIPGDTLVLRAGTYPVDSITGWPAGTAANPIVLQPYQTETPLIDGSIYADTAYLTVKNLHIKDLDFLDRISAQASGNPTDIGSTHDGLRAYKSNLIFQDCIIENCRQGIYKNSIVTNLIIDGCIMFHNGWVGPDRPHGHGGYFPGQYTTIQNSIMFTNFEFGTKVYDEGTYRPAINDNIMQDNIAFNNSVIGGQVGTRGDLLFGHNDLPFYRPIMRRNYTYQAAAYRPPAGTNVNHLGYQQPFYDAIYVDNYFPNNIYITDELGSTFLQNSGNVIAPEESNKIALISVRGRLHCAIYNWELLESVAVDLSAYWSPGDTIQMTQVTDYFVDIDTQVIAGDGTITIDMQASSHTVQTPLGMAEPDSCFPEFGCFVLEKL